MHRSSYKTRSNFRKRPPPASLDRPRLRPVITESPICREIPSPARLDEGFPVELSQRPREQLPSSRENNWSSTAIIDKCSVVVSAGVAERSPRRTRTTDAARCCPKPQRLGFDSRLRDIYSQTYVQCATLFSGGRAKNDASYLTRLN